MGGLPSHGVAIAACQTELQHERVHNGIATKRLTCHGETELGIEAGLGGAEDGVFRRAQQRAGRTGRVNRVEIRVAHDGHGVSMVDVDVFVLADQVVADGVRRLSARGEGQ